MPSYLMEQPLRPGTETDTDDRSGGVASRRTERLRSPFGRLQGLVRRYAQDVWQQGPKTQHSNEVFDRLPPTSERTGQGLRQLNQSKLESSAMAPAEQQEPL
jgi:hypothetical protein